MKISAIHDFYYLMALSNQPAKFGNKAQEKLHDDVCKAYNKLTETLALALYHYLFLACFGEARHARSQADAWYNDLPMGSSRDSAYASALKFDPKPTLNALSNLFSYSWHGGGYGGGSWGRIVEGARKYGVLDDVSFIDHVVDLEHNGGNAFDKVEVRHAIDLVLDSTYMTKFLDYKANKDILAKCDEEFYMDYVCYWNITLTTYNLLKRYYITRGIDMPEHIKEIPTVSTDTQWKYSEPSFGTKIPTDLEERTEDYYDEDYEEEEQLPINRIYDRYIQAINHLPVYPLKREEVCAV